MNTSSTTTSTSTITNLVEPSNGGAMTVPVSVPSPNLFGDNSPQKLKVKHTVKDTFSAKILLEMKNLSNSAPNSPLPTQAPPSPSFLMNSSSNSDQTVVGTPLTTAPTVSSTSSCINSPFIVSETIPIPNTSHQQNFNNNNMVPSSPTSIGLENCLNQHVGNNMVSCSFKDCLLCKRGTPFVNNQSPTWACIMKIVFYCLQHEMPQKPFLNLKIDVYGFMTAHWHLLCLDKKKSDNWHKQIQDMLSHSKNLFESGMDTYKQNGYWRMRQISDPWDEIKSKKSSSHHNSHHNTSSNSNSTSHQTKRKRSYSESDSSHFNKSDKSKNSDKSTTNNNVPNSTTNADKSSASVPIQISSTNSSVSSSSLLIPSSPTSTGILDSNDSSFDDIIMNESSNMNNNSSILPTTPNLILPIPTPSGGLSMMSEKSIDKQIHDNFNQLSYQLKLNAKKNGVTSSTINNLITSTNNNNSTPSKSKKKLKINHSTSPMITLTNISSNSNSTFDSTVIPPLPMIPSYLSGCDIPSSPSLNFPSSPRSSPRPSPRNSPTPIILVSTTTSLPPPVSSPFQPINDRTVTFIDNKNSNEIPQPINTTSSILSQLCEIYQQDRNETLMTIDNNNNKSLNSSFSNLSSSSSTPSSPITSTISSNGELNDEIQQLKDQLRQIKENLKSIKDNTQIVDKNSLSSMIEKEIDRISSLLFNHTNNNNNINLNSSGNQVEQQLQPQCKDKLLLSTNSSSTSSPTIISIDSPPTHPSSNQKTVNLSITLEDCVPQSRLSGLSALSMAATNNY